jgi:hypothetical protein
MKKLLFLLTYCFVLFTACHKDAAAALPSPQTTTTAGNVVTTAVTVPTSVQDAIFSKYPGYTIYESVKEDSYWQVYYRVTIRQGSGNTRIVLMYSLDWVYLGIKS